MTLEAVNVPIHARQRYVFVYKVLSRTECHASSNSLCRHVGDLSTISTFSKSISWLWSTWCLANKEFLSNVAMAFARSFTRVFSARDV